MSMLFLACLAAKSCQDFQACEDPFAIGAPASQAGSWRSGVAVIHAP